MKKSFSDTCNFAPLTGNFLYSKKIFENFFRKIDKRFYFIFRLKSNFLFSNCAPSKTSHSIESETKVEKISC